MSSDWVYILVAVFLAIALDAWIAYQVSKYWRRRSESDCQLESEVRVLGMTSPMLTWLRYELPRVTIDKLFQVVRAGRALLRDLRAAWQALMRKLRAAGQALMRALRIVGQALVGKLRVAFQPEPWRAALWTAFDVRDGTLVMILFGLALVVYALTRFIALDKFPIYFFCDEAVSTVQAADFIRHGLRDSMGHFLPTYFQNDRIYSLGTTVYLQVIPYLMFGKSVIVTRGVSALVSLFGTAAIGLTLKNVFRVRWWWAGVMLLSITPAWFLHSRTAWETVTMVSFYAWFLYFYLLYRQGNLRLLFPALLFGALAFYSYNGGRIVVVLTGSFLLISDARYHWANRRVGKWGLAFLGLLCLPYLRFLIEQPGADLIHLREAGTYWFAKGLTLGQKLTRFWRNYMQGLDPRYWYLPNIIDWHRHQMKGYGYILLATAPLMVVGILVCLRRCKSAAHRALLIALLVAPTGGALAGVSIPRLLVLVVPATLIAALGLETLRSWAPERFVPAGVTVGVFALLGVVNIGMLRDALVNGPTWFTDYGLNTMQYGAGQVFGEVKSVLLQSPQTTVVLSYTWTNNPLTLLRFFVGDDPRVRLGAVGDYLRQQRPLTDTMLSVMTPEEYQQALASPKLTDVQLEKTLPYPDGRPGFFFARFRYSDVADELFARDALARRELVDDVVDLDGQKVQVRHSQAEAGWFPDLFDGDLDTQVRLVREASPVIVELTFPVPRVVSSVAVSVRSMDLSLTALLYANENEPFVYTQAFTHLPPDPTVNLTWPPRQVAKLRIEVQCVGCSNEFQTQIREIAIK